MTLWLIDYLIDYLTTAFAAGDQALPQGWGGLPPMVALDSPESSVVRCTVLSTGGIQLPSNRAGSTRSGLRSHLEFSRRCLRRRDLQGRHIMVNISRGLNHVNCATHPREAENMVLQLHHDVVWAKIYETSGWTTQCNVVEWWKKVLRVEEISAACAHGTLP